MFKTYQQYPDLRFLDCQQGSAEWHSERGTVGSSEFKMSDAGGQGKTRKSLMIRKVIQEYTGVTEETVETWDMKQGKLREAEAATEFESITGLSIFHVGLMKNIEYPGFHSSPDSLIKTAEGLYGFEVKCPKDTTQIKWMGELSKNQDRHCPLEHRKQIDMHCIIGNLLGCFFFSYVPLKYVHDYALERTDGKWAQILRLVPAPVGAAKAAYVASMNKWNTDYAAMLPTAPILVEKRIREQLEKKNKLSAAITAVDNQTKDLIGKLR
jgi:hypothetical protein